MTCGTLSTKYNCKFFIYFSILRSVFVFSVLFFCYSYFCCPMERNTVDVLNVSLYRAKACSVMKVNGKRLEAFYHACLGRLLTLFNFICLPSLMVETIDQYRCEGNKTIVSRPSLMCFPLKHTFLGHDTVSTSPSVKGSSQSDDIDFLQP